jgi:hypothetical protein
MTAREKHIARVFACIGAACGLGFSLGILSLVGAFSRIAGLQ